MSKSHRNPYLLVGVGAFLTVVGMVILLNLTTKSETETTALPKVEKSIPPVPPASPNVIVKDESKPKPPEPLDPLAPTIIQNKDIDLNSFPWKPGNDLPPMPRELNRQAEYERAEATLLTTFDASYWLDPRFPTNGILIYGILPAGQADRAGVSINDILVCMDGKIVSDNQQFSLLRSLNKNQVLKFWSPKKGYFDLDVKPGKVGFDLMGDCFLGGEYIRLRESSPKWDDSIKIVIAALHDCRPNLAETALCHAVKSGYQGKLIPQFMCRIARLQVSGITYFSAVSLR